MVHTIRVTGGVKRRRSSAGIRGRKSVRYAYWPRATEFNFTAPLLAL